jgi:predicted RNase H-like nuclease (RuvC/YqgF family)
MTDNSEIQKLKQEMKQSAFDYNNQINELQNMITDQKLNTQVQMQEKDNKIMELTEMLTNQKENVKPKAKRSNVND